MHPKINSGYYQPEYSSKNFCDDWKDKAQCLELADHLFGLEAEVQFLISALHVCVGELHSTPFSGGKFVYSDGKKAYDKSKPYTKSNNRVTTKKDREKNF